MKPWHVVGAFVLAPTLIAVILWANNSNEVFNLTGSSEPAVPERSLKAYEWFQWTAKRHGEIVGHIEAYELLLAAEADPRERSRLRVEIITSKQMCYDLVEQYSARAHRFGLNRLKAASLPESLSYVRC